MRGEPRGESASPSEARPARVQSSRALARVARLRTPEQFAAAVGERATWRASRQWVAASAWLGPRSDGPQLQDAAPRSGDSVGSLISLPGSESQTDAVRFGFTVGRRQARRAVQRVMVKRVLREAARNAAGTLRPLAGNRGLDVVLRLRSPLPDRSQMALAQVKRSLRAEADSLIGQLARHLRASA